MTAGDRLIRWGAAVATAVVAGIAAVISYGHAYELAVTYGESGATARALPLTVDGLIVTCSLVLLDAARRGHRAPVLPWVLLAAGIAATVGANVAHGLDHGPVGAVIAGWPALVAVGSFEMLARLIRGHRPAEGVVEQDQAAEDEFVLDVAEVDEQAEPEPAEDDGPPVDDIPVPEPVAVDPALAAVVATARDRFADVIAAGGLPSVRTIRREMRVGYPRAVAVRAALDPA
ncbi:DUF2637 domain-containing protein [Actinomadura algeriensis]|uniref:DUF2637 domain-containing protein n=1 Tax=Actinomadura algeriensis TaxID=1679523 RepID=A0ABR9JKR9_9ACTN|nr:DUF2637 domain-containing protein [Actinomadura algeriensis]MBE1531142.1 hypothetical protein [Actinomadura algeriensis]